MIWGVIGDICGGAPHPDARYLMGAPIVCGKNRATSRDYATAEASRGGETDFPRSQRPMPP